MPFRHKSEKAATIERAMIFSSQRKVYVVALIVLIFQGPFGSSVPAAEPSTLSSATTSRLKSAQLVTEALAGLAVNGDATSARTKLLRAHDLDPTYAAPLFALGSLCERTEDWDGAIAYLQKCVAVAPESVYATQAADRIEADRRAREMDKTPEGKRKRRFAMAAGAAQALLAQKAPGPAGDFAQRAIQADPDRWEGYVLYSSAKIMDGDLAGAADALRTAVVKAPSDLKNSISAQLTQLESNQKVRALVGASLVARRRGHEAEAVEDLDKAYAISGKNDQVGLALAQSQLVAGDYTSAATILAKLTSSADKVVSKTAANLLEMISPQVAKQKQPPEIFTNSMSMSFSRIGPGGFLMGAAESARETASRSGGRSDEFEDELPRHFARISKPFYLSTHLITRAQFALFVSFTGYKTEAERGSATMLRQTGTRSAGNSWRDPGFHQRDDEPVVCVSWNDSVAFCRWLSQKEGRNYRLPTEAEWEFACRAGTVTAFPWGENQADGKEWANCADKSTKASGLDKSRFTWSDSYSFTSPVGSFRSNAWGLYDMIGNAREWCSDWHGVYGNGDVVDPSGGPEGLFKIIRGGSWADGPSECRSSSRSCGTVTSSDNSTGFRLALDK